MTLCVFLTALIWIIYAQTLSFQFLSFDDETFVSANPHINHGLNLHDLAWEFTHIDADNWHPLTAWSHMLDCSIFGLQAGGHHLINVLLHNAAALLIFFWLVQATAQRSESFFVAAIFAIHPQHVESVAWISERKDVLSAVFFALTLITYSWYTRRAAIGRYVALSFTFVLALMTKPMMVSVPFVLFLLDYWPLRRIADRHSATKCLLEKIPLGVFAAAVALITLLAQEHGVVTIRDLPLEWRLANAAVALVQYMAQFFWPAGLSPYYPHPGNTLSTLGVVGSVLVLTSLTALVAFAKKKYLVTGWAWFIIMLLPVLGLVQVSTQGRADRYTYLAEIGFSIAVVWLVSQVARTRGVRICFNVLGMLVIFFFTFLARKTAADWRESATVWNRALALYPGSPIVHYNFAGVLFRQDRFDEAVPHLQFTLRALPQHAEAHFDLGLILVQRNEADAAIAEFRAALANGYESGLLHDQLGAALAKKGLAAEARAEFENALRIQPNLASAESGLGELLLAGGDSSGALPHFRRLVALAPDNPTAHYNLAVNLQRLGQKREAIEEYQRTLQLDPSYPDARENVTALAVEEKRQ